MSNFEPDQLAIASLVGAEVVQVPSTASLQDVAARMNEDGISAVGVGDETLVGVITERDIVRAVAIGSDPLTPAIELAETNLFWTDPESTVAEVAEEMMTRWIRHVFVGQPGNLVGIVSMRDLLVAYVDIAPV
ncbi:MAG: CBS domain-containing protein [Microthrixaceae bacterium]|nr:CBS domain-containing protein [Microthrixaceae bacterium]